MNYETAKNYFEKFLNCNFDISDKKISHKINHTYNVVENAKYLCKCLKLDEVNTELAMIIALLHDIGRFDQAKEMQTFREDITNFDHATLGVKLLFEKGEIKNYIGDKQFYLIIEKAIANHSKYILDETGMSNIEILHCKIIRDADKIDIFNIWANLDEMEIKSDGEISLEVVNEFFEGKMIHNENKKTNADNVIGTLSYIYDIFYKETFEYIDCQNFLNNLFERLEEKDKFKIFFDEADRYIKECKKGDKKYVRKKI